MVRPYLIRALRLAKRHRLAVVSGQHGCRCVHGVVGRVLPRHHTPAVPRQHLHLVERCQIAGDVAGHEPLAPLLVDPEPFTVDLTGTTRLPGLPAGEELLGAQVGGIGEAGDLLLQLIDLRVEHPPALTIPVLDHPVMPFYTETCTCRAANTTAVNWRAVFVTDAMA